MRRRMPTSNRLRPLISETWKFLFDRKFEDLLIDRLKRNPEVVSRALSDPERLKMIRDLYAAEVYPTCCKSAQSAACGGQKQPPSDYAIVDYSYCRRRRKMVRQHKRHIGCVLPNGSRIPFSTPTELWITSKDGLQARRLMETWDSLVGAVLVTGRETDSLFAPRSVVLISPPPGKLESMAVGCANYFHIGTSLAWFPPAGLRMAISASLLAWVLFGGRQKP